MFLAQKRESLPIPTAKCGTGTISKISESMELFRQHTAIPIVQYWELKEKSTKKSQSSVEKFRTLVGPSFPGKSFQLLYEIFPS